MYEFMAWLEGSSLGGAMRESGVWTYGIVNLTHILGVASLFGALLVLDLRLLGAWRQLALSDIAKATVPVATAGFTVAATSGICLVATNATEYIGNPFLYIKFPAIILGLLNVAVLHLLPAWKERSVRKLTSGEKLQLSVVGGISLACWLTAISAGRLIAYW